MRSFAAAAVLLLSARASGAVASDAIRMEEAAGAGPLLIGASTVPVAVSDPALLRLLLADPRLAGYTGASLRDPGLCDESWRRDGGRRFVFAFALKNCADCPEAAQVRVAYDFDSNRRYLNANLLTVEEPPLFAVSGEAVRGRDFEARIDAQRVFRLKAFSEGWIVEVVDEKGRDYCSVVTPPYRGTNGLEIFGWHFRNADNTGPNGPGLKNVSAPGARREFACVATAADFEAADKSLRLVLWPDKSASWKDTDEASRLHGRVAAGAQRGVLTMSGLVLGNLGPGRRPWIESMRFRFELRPAAPPPP